MLLIMRFLFGAGEAGAWPCVARTFSRWIPARERGTIQGIFFAGAHLAGGLTPLVVVALQPYLPWRAIFVCFGLVGFVWAVVWHALVPRRSRATSRGERRGARAHRSRAAAQTARTWRAGPTGGD